MIQDILPSRLDNSFRRIDPEEGDFFLTFDREGKILVRPKGDRLEFPIWSQEDASKESVFLFMLDESRFFMNLSAVHAAWKADLKNEEPAQAGRDEVFVYKTMRELRGTCINADLMVCFTAYHLWHWYAHNLFCSRCGHRLALSDKERALECRDCGTIFYPRINPAVIVGVTRGDELLITRYRKGYAHNALVAGFTEIGETLEETVKREVMEETGVSVDNIRYYKSQPWGMAQDILVGFFCDAAKDAEIHMDENELKYAQWVKRDEIELQPSDISLTNEMMKVFRDGMNP